MKNFCILTLLLLFQSLGNVVFAQVEQKGVVLEYNRQKAKKPYLPPVQLLFNTVPAINSGKDGRFRLEFNTAKPGDLVTDYEVKPGDSNFVLFNGRDLHNWALTSKKDMKVEICKKELLDYLDEKFTRHEKYKIERERDEALRKWEMSKGLIEEKEKILEKYKIQNEELQSRVSEYVYQDETKLDSLQLLWRHYILTNDYDAADEVLQQMNLRESTRKRRELISNILNASDEEVKKLEYECDFLHKRIQSNKKHGKSWQIIKPDYVSLINSYLFLLDTYQNRLRCSDDYLASLKDNTGKIMFEYADTLSWIDNDSCMYWYNESAKYDNVPACYMLGEKIEDYKSSLSWYKKAWEIAIYKNQKSWVGHNNQGMTLEDIKNAIESYPDFCYVYKGDSLFFHILDSNRASLVYFRHSSDANIVTIPSKVKYNGNNYLVTKIGTGAINNISFGGMQKSDNPWLQYIYTHNDSRNNISSVLLPNSIDTISLNSIGTIGNVPKELKYLGSWNGFSKSLKTVQLSPQMSFMGDVSLDNDQTLVIPALLQEIGYTTSAGKVVLDQDNKNYTIINGALYSADKSKVWIGTVDSLLYIPRELKVSEGWWTGVGYVAEHIMDFKLDNESPYYTEYNGALYSKNCDTLFFMTKKHPATLKLHPKTKVIANIHHLTNTYGIKDILVSSVSNFDAIDYLFDLCHQSYASSYMSDVTLHLFDNDIITLYPNKFDVVISQAELLCKKYQGDEKYLYLCGLLYVINHDIEGIKSCYSKMPQESELAKKLYNRLKIYEE